MGAAMFMTQAAGAANNAVSAYYGAKSQKSSLQFQAGLDDINARLSEQAAQTALMQGEREEQRTRLNTANLKSSQTASLAAHGVDVGEGSAAEILTSTDVMGEVDANTVHANAVRAAMGYRTQGVNYQNDALMKRAGADSISPNTALASSLITGASQVASSWYTLDKAGAFGNGTATKQDPALAKANKTDDPIGAYGKSKGWY